MLGRGQGGGPGGVGGSLGDIKRRLGFAAGQGEQLFRLVLQRGRVETVVLRVTEPLLQERTPRCPREAACQFSRNLPNVPDIAWASRLFGSLCRMKFSDVQSSSAGSKVVIPRVTDDTGLDGVIAISGHGQRKGKVAVGLGHRGTILPIILTLGLAERDRDRLPIGVGNVPDDDRCRNDAADALGFATVNWSIRALMTLGSASVEANRSPIRWP